MKKSLRKLTLSRETIGRLEQERLGEALGGATHSCNTLCETRCFACISENTQCNTGCIPCGTATACLQTYNC